MNMRPEQFTMWLRGVLDTNGAGAPISADVAGSIYNQLSTVVAGQVAERFIASNETPAYKNPLPLGRLARYEQQANMIGAVETPDVAIGT